jgi:hypothetical protein
MNGKGCGRKRSWPVNRNYAGIRLEGLRETIKHPSEENLYPGRHSNQTTREYKPQALANLFSYEFILSGTKSERSTQRG